MRAHVAQTIRDIEQSMERGRQLIQLLQDFEGGVSGVPATAVETVAPTATEHPLHKMMVREARRNGGVAKHNRTGEKRYSGKQKLIEVCAGLTPPFGALELSKATGQDMKQAGSALSYLCRKGQLVVLEAGAAGRPARYQVSKGVLKKLGKNGTNGSDGTDGTGRAGKEEGSADGSNGSSRLSIPGLDPEPEVSIEQQLEKALKERDDARAKGLTRLERILQDKVDKLQKQLEAK